MEKTETEGLSIGAGMAGGNAINPESVKARADSDFYPTPEPVTEALIRAERKHLSVFTHVWEPACGQGAMAKVIEREGYSVIGTDLVDRGYGEGGVDFMRCDTLKAPAIITNPPYKDDLPEAFIMKAHTLGTVYLALLLKAQFFHTAGRYRLWNNFRPAREYKLTWRPDFLGLGGGTMDCSWWVWDWRGLNYSRTCQVELLRRPDPLNLEGAL
ncbi:MAG: SAM-dependent DNA methyltransferase [Alphaproteobacteria bacterium]